MLIRLIDDVDAGIIWFVFPYPFLFIIYYPLYFFCSQFIAKTIISGNWTLEKLQSPGGRYHGHLINNRLVITGLCSEL